MTWEAVTTGAEAIALYGQMYQCACKTTRMSVRLENGLMSAQYHRTRWVCPDVPVYGEVRRKDFYFKDGSTVARDLTGYGRGESPRLLGGAKDKSDPKANDKGK